MLIEVDIQKKTCNRLAQAPENISAKSKEREECKREGTRWVALRMCLSCGHVVGCCDLSPGRHATRHFTGTEHHPVMVALPDGCRDGVLCSQSLGIKRKEREIAEK